MNDVDAGLDQETLVWFQSLDPDEQAEFVELLEEAVGEQWELSPKQEYAEALWHKCDWLLYGGAAGGGKTELMIKHANDLSTKVPGHATLVLRQSIPELRRSIILRLKARLVQFRLPGKLRKVDGVTQFLYQNDSLIECGYCATDEHVANYLSAEYDLLLIDEASLMTADQITQLSSRLRTTKRKARLGARPHLGLFSNPGGPSHAWLHEIFVASTDYGSRVVVVDITQGIEHPQIVRTYPAPCTPDGATDEQLEQLRVWADELTIEVDPQNELVLGFVPAKASDNKYIDPGYMKYLNALPERRRRQLRDGDWDTFEGQYFHEWNRDIHVVDWFEIPESWQHARGLDFGSSAPWACLMGAWDNDGNCYLYDECYGPGFTPQDQAAQAKAAQSRTLANGKVVKINYFASLADPSVFADKRGTGKSIADLWRIAGLHVNRAKNARVAGWQNVRQYLWDNDLQTPRLFVLRGTCPNLVRTIPLQQTDKKHPEDLDTRLEDHAMDALRYLLSARPIGQKVPEQKVGLTIDQRFNKMLRNLDKRPRTRLFH
jgi:hypothetical protein